MSKAYFFSPQSLIADNDGIMDAPGMFSERTKPLIKVYSLLFTTLSVFLSWPGLQQEENNQILIGKIFLFFCYYFYCTFYLIVIVKCTFKLSLSVIITLIIIIIIIINLLSFMSSTICDTLKFLLTKSTCLLPHIFHSLSDVWQMVLIQPMPVWKQT